MFWEGLPRMQMLRGIFAAFDDNKNVMALKVRNHNVWGVQFHPESILTEKGKDILKNWIEAK